MGKKESKESGQGTNGVPEEVVLVIQVSGKNKSTMRARENDSCGSGER